ncbi:hypothetical protein MLD38_004957 [Melastoma candidum]|uniref:Uncharacterized protein n=1 Tax=Melastoma candidum TaxID=119954 RepID=A0ACB9S7S1_9MYRT|nr:hypothetical protein MLD38_004957 [Melastoma candidum]
MDLNDLNKVWEVRPLKKPGEDEARRILERVAKQVQPIMRKRHWRVKLLSEFCPPNPSLMGLNIDGGSEVKLRLRRQNGEWAFFPYEQILDTMLHELCHNEVGPHNADFYKLLDEIRKECEELMAKGITGSGRGFDLPGRRLGGFSRQPPPSALRQTALAAAEERARRGALLPPGPRRLGGDSDIRIALSPTQAAAMAAERRLHDDLWCGSKAPVASPSSVNPDKLERINGSSSHITGPCGEPTWDCKICTLVNQALAINCEACGSKRERDVEVQGHKKVWSCKFCTLDNGVDSRDRCMACGEWRYSYGTPASSHLAT